MADKPILFSAPIVRALFDGSKTQTRRIIKPQPPEGFDRHCWYDAPLYGFTRQPIPTCKWHIVRLHAYKGDRLWVRERWSGVHDFGETPPSERQSYTTPVGPVLRDEIWYWADGTPDFGDWEKPRPGIHMPRWASRLTLIVTDVRVERLQDISEEDAAAEGVPSDDNYAGSFAKEYCHRCGGSGLHGAFGQNYGVIEVDCAECETSKLRYRNLWNHINGPGAWDANPWVVAYTFTVMRGNIDQIGGA
ncbi:hypothetical protein IFT84_17670 [Rhizobium sp. CFBP 8762]|uniref:hypothetical protein n=1 Tax=Rhizobium sp. CFBP 8762 TaxID=2775279 RepID=UPI001782A71D|nr:hypothetical protein [Rhizobium sp. CFBP 8762]MBD8556340.1 hypothetical protein [Rhizobium sp. CFBP 8762]